VQQRRDAKKPERISGELEIDVSFAGSGGNTNEIAPAAEETVAEEKASKKSSSTLSKTITAYGILTREQRSPLRSPLRSPKQRLTLWRQRRLSLPWRSRELWILFQ
jgi:hypothetical protein